VFVDEADDLVHARQRDVEYSESLVKHLLVALDSTAHDVRSFFVFATNLEPEHVDAALCRPGRLGRPIIFRYLDREERIALLQKTAQRYEVDPGLQLGPVAAQLAGMPTASLALLFDDAAFLAWRAGRDRIDQSDVHEAVARVSAGLPRTRPLTDDELRRVAAHEAGHALARIVLWGRFDAVAYVRLDARAEGQLGAAALESWDESTLTEDQIDQLLIEGLAGRAAERLLFGSSDTGSAHDLAAVNRIALRAVRDWGFSSRGPRTAPEYAEAIVEARVDRAVQHMLRDAESRTESLLREHWAALEALTERLIAHRRADANDLRGWLEAFLPELSIADRPESPS
jgi:cell division protease FtsH